jgi:hypothetical protein
MAAGLAGAVTTAPTVIDLPAMASTDAFKGSSQQPLEGATADRPTYMRAAVRVD